MTAAPGEVLCHRCGHGWSAHTTGGCHRPCHGGCTHGPRCDCPGFRWVDPAGRTGSYRDRP